MKKSSFENFIVGIIGDKNSKALIRLVDSVVENYNTIDETYGYVNGVAETLCVLYNIDDDTTIKSIHTAFTEIANNKYYEERAKEIYYLDFDEDIIEELAQNPNDIKDFVEHHVPYERDEVKENIYDMLKNDVLTFLSSHYVNFINTQK